LDGTRSLCRIASSAYAVEAMRVTTKEVIVSTLIGGVREIREGGLGVDEGTSCVPSSYIAFPSARDDHGWTGRHSDLPARARGETTKPSSECDTT